MLKVMDSYFPEGYAPETPAKFSITLVFEHKNEDLIAILGIPQQLAQLSILHTGLQLRGFAPYLGISGRLDEQYYHIRLDEDGWSAIHVSHPNLAGAFIRQYDEVKGEGSYQKKREEFSKYLEGRIAEAHRQMHASDFDSVDALLLHGAQLREKHRKMREAFEREMGVSYYPYCPKPTAMQHHTHTDDLKCMDSLLESGRQMFEKHTAMVKLFEKETIF